MSRKIIVAGLIAAVCASSAFAAKDKFNRADLGNKWVVTSGSLYISNNHLAGDSASLGYFKRAKKDDEATVKVTLDSSYDLEYGAVAIGNIAGGNNAFVKIQSQNGAGTFDTAGFYVGNNGGGSFFTLDSPVSSPATLTVSISGTVATMTVKSASGTQSYQYDYGTSFGDGVGLGTYGLVALDNLKTSAVAELGVSPKRVTQSNAIDRSR